MFFLWFLIAATNSQHISVNALVVANCICCIAFKWITHDLWEADAAVNACSLKCSDINYSLCSTEPHVLLSPRRPRFFSEHAQHRQLHHGLAHLLHAMCTLSTLWKKSCCSFRSNWAIEPSLTLEEIYCWNFYSGMLLIQKYVQLNYFLM